MDSEDNNPESEDENGTGSASAGLTRRVVLKSSGGLALIALVPISLSACGGSSGGLGDGETASGAPPGGGSGGPPTEPVSFLTESELNTLRAAVDRFIPGQPEDSQPGAVEAQCAEAISLFLGAFLTNPPFIYAGAPFSDRAGHPTNEFTRFLPLDPYEETAWRLLIEGSQGRTELEFNGPVVGHQQIYRDGLARLNERAGGDFSSASAMERDNILNDDGDAVVQAFVDVAYFDTLEFMYGPPEYGGNQGLVGWTNNDFQGDVQPNGWTDDRVINPDNPGPLDFLLPPSYGMGNNPGRRVERQPATGTVPAQRAPTIRTLIAGDSVSAAMSSANGSTRQFRAQLRMLTGNGGKRGA